MKKVLFTLLSLAFFFSGALAQDIRNPKIKWKFKTQGPIRGDAVLHKDRLYFGSSDGFLYSVDKDDGSLNWKYQTGGALTGAPAVTDDAAFISSRDNFVYSINTNSGVLNWKFEMQPILPDGAAGWEYFMAAPVANGNKVLVGSGDGHLYSLDAKSGELLWKFKTNGRVRATPQVHQNVIYQPSNDGFVYALDTEKGKLLWKFETKGATYNSQEYGFDRNSIFAQPIVKDNLLIIASRDGNTYAVDLKTHNEKWSFTYGSTWAMSTAVSDNAVFVGWSTNNLTCAIDLQTGKEIWKYTCGAHNYARPLVLDSGVYVGSADGMLHRLNKFTGEKVWEYSIGREIYSSPLYDSGTLFFGSDDGFYYALEEGKKPYLAVYLPTTIKGNTQYLVVDPKIAPYLCEKGFEQLDSAALHRFISERIEDGQSSAVVFALPIIPKNIIGEDPQTGMIRKYLEAGGKVVWMGDIPNFYEPDETGNFKRDASAGTQLLDVTFEFLRESGNYYSRATQEGLNLGLPQWMKTTNSTVSTKSVIPLAYDEYGRVSLWLKKFHPRPGSGFVSCRTWSWNVPITDEDLRIIYRLATYGLL